MGEYLGQEFVIDLIQLLESVLQSDFVGAGYEVENLSEAEGGVVHYLLGVLESLGIVGEVDVDEVGVTVDLGEGVGGLFCVTVGDLSASLPGHGVDELGIEEALLAGIGLAGAQLKLGECVGAGNGFVSGGAGRDYGAEGGENPEASDEQNWTEWTSETGCGTKERAHESPLGDRVLTSRACFACLLYVLEGGETGAGLQLLIGQCSMGRCEKLFVERCGIDSMMQIVVRRCLEEE